jgi:hypothetical protein
LLYAALAIGVIYLCETHLRTPVVEPASMFWLDGQSPWAPDENLCPWCGSELTARVDAFSACRHCERCGVSFRHKSLPSTLEEQARVWK